MEQPTNQIETWAIVENMGHTKLAGMARTEPFGTVMMLRVDVPELPEHRKTEKQSWDSRTGRYFETPQDVEVVQPAEDGYTRYFGLQAVFSITPCDEPTARAAAERMRKRPAKVLRLTPELPAPAVPAAGETAEDRIEQSLAGVSLSEHQDDDHDDDDDFDHDGDDD
jgi:hypothetical protein